MDVEVYNLIDTSLKIGLGAIIAGSSSYFLSIRNHKNDINKQKIVDKKSLVRELAFKLEYIEGCSNEVALFFHSGNVEKAKESLIPATQDAYAARAIANLVGNDDLVNAIDTIAEATEDIFHVLNTSEPSLDELERLGATLKDSKIVVYPHIRETYDL